MKPTKNFDFFIFDKFIADEFHMLSFDFENKFCVVQTGMHIHGRMHGGTGSFVFLQWIC